MYTDTSYGDYPLHSPDHPTKAGLHTGWMLLSYKGKATVSSSKKQISKSTSTDGQFDITEMPLKKNDDGEILSEVLTDESPKSFWVAEANDDNQWVEIEMLAPGNIYAFQVNFHDEESGIYARVRLRVLDKVGRVIVQEPPERLFLLSGTFGPQDFLDEPRNAFSHESGDVFHA